jgi:L-fuculose-phosphate aldolase
MLLPAAREAIVSACQELSRGGLVVGTAGNVSVREGDLVAVTPTGVRYAALTPELVGVHRLDGTAVEAPLQPTSELPLHLAVYRARPDAGAVVHTHPVAATALRDRDGCLLANHGAVTLGPDLAAAHDKSVYLEWLCDVYLRAVSAGTPRLLPAAEIAAAAARLARYGQPR